jgi:GTP-binding protein HflX
MQETSPGSEAAILVSIDLGDTDYQESLAELRLLAETAGVRTTNYPLRRCATSRSS